MTVEDFVDEFNELRQGSYFKAIGDNQGRIKILNASEKIVFDYNGEIWEFRGSDDTIFKLSSKTLELMAEYAKGDINEHIGLDWED